MVRECAGATDGLINKNDPHVFVWNSTSTHMRLQAGTVVGKMHPVTVVKETTKDSIRRRNPSVWNASVKKVEIETLEDCDDDGGDSYVAPDLMPLQEECPIAELIKNSDIIRPEDRAKALQMLYRNKVAFALPGTG